MAASVDIFGVDFRGGSLMVESVEKTRVIFEKVRSWLNLSKIICVCNGIAMMAALLVTITS